MRLEDVQTIWHLGAGERFNEPLPKLTEEDLGPSRTITTGGRAIAVVGLRPVTGWVAEVWALVDVQACLGNPVGTLGLHRACVRLLNEETKVYHRLEANILASEPRFCRWAERLGFVREGLKRCYGPRREHFWSYARVQ